MNGNDRLREELREFVTRMEQAAMHSLGGVPCSRVRDWSSELSALLAQEGAAAPEGEGWQPKPLEAGWYWHFDGDVTWMRYVFPRPGHSYLAVYDDPNPATGKRQFRMAEKMGGQWYGPLSIPARPEPTR